MIYGVQNCKVAICGPALSGKDQFADYLAQISGLSRGLSTSHSFCFLHRLDRDRVCQNPQGRRWLADVMAKYNLSDGSACRLYKEMTGVETASALLAEPAVALEDGEGAQLPQTDIVVGIRRLSELKAAYETGCVDAGLWIDRPGMPEDATLDYDEQAMGDLFGERFLVVDNSQGLEHLYREAVEAWDWISSGCR